MKEPIKIPFEESFRFTSYSYPIYAYEVESFGEILEDIIYEIDLLETKLSQNRNVFEKSPYFSDGNTSTNNVLTCCHKLYNFLLGENKSDSIKYLKDQIGSFAKHYASTVFNYSGEINYYCWCNKIKNEEFLTEHSHGSLDSQYFSSFSANLSVSCDDTYTYYASPYHNVLNRRQIAIKNKNGYMTIFPNCLRHGTVPNLHKEGMRYTLGMDIFSTQENVDVPEYIIDNF